MLREPEDVPKGPACAACGAETWFQVWESPLCNPCVTAWDREVPYADEVADNAQRWAEMERRTKQWAANRKARAA